jgi:toxin ParE1/3/4
VKARFSPEALADLEEIGDFIARDDPAAASRWIERLVARAEQAARAPRSGRIVPEVRDPEVREVFVRSYRIIYRIERHRVLILTIIEGHRRLRPTW